MEDVLYSVKETSQLLKTNTDYVYKLIRLGMLPALKLGSYKVRKVSLLLFLEKYEGKDLTNPEDIQDLAIETSRSVERSTY
jgi:excisionase family DNA binding protein